MTRTRWYIFHTLTVMSALLLLGTIVLWLRSFEHDMRILWPFYLIPYSFMAILFTLLPADWFIRWAYGDWPQLVVTFVKTLKWRYVLCAAGIVGP